MMLRTRIDPKTGAHTLREPAQSKCAWNKWTLQKSHFAREFTGKMPPAKTREHTGDHTLCEPAQSKYTSTFHKSHFLREFTGKRPGPKTGTHTLREKAQSKCTWTFHKGHFMRDFRGKMPRTSWSTLSKHRPLQYTYPKNPSVLTHCLRRKNKKEAGSRRDQGGTECPGSSSCATAPHPAKHPSGPPRTPSNFEFGV
jgi:hypothetical protein